MSNPGQSKPRSGQRNPGTVVPESQPATESGHRMCRTGATMSSSDVSDSPPLLPTAPAPAPAPKRTSGSHEHSQQSRLPSPA